MDDKNDPPKRKPPKADLNEPPIDQDPAVERGERIDTGKTIQRGGKDHGAVPGATEEDAEKR